MTTDVDVAWLVNVSHSAGQVSLSFIRARGAEPFRWVDSNFQPYYLTKEEQGGEPIAKRDLFTQNDLTLYKMS